MVYCGAAGLILMEAFEKGADCYSSTGEASRSQAPITRRMQLNRGRLVYGKLVIIAHERIICVSNALGC